MASTSRIARLLCGAALAIGISGGAQAASLAITGGVAGVIPGGSATNEALAPLGLNNPQSGYYGSTIKLVGNAHVTFTLLGAEAGNVNRFTYTGPGGGSLTDAAGGSAFSTLGFGSITLTNVLQGLLGFTFDTDNGALSVANGSNPNNTAPVGPAGPGVNFFATFADAGNSRSGNNLLLFFDDDGANNDDNHDDLVIRVSVAAVPLPASAMLLGLGLAGLGAARLRRKQA